MSFHEFLSLTQTIFIQAQKISSMALLSLKKLRTSIKRKILKHVFKKWNYQLVLWYSLKEVFLLTLDGRDITDFVSQGKILVKGEVTHKCGYSLPIIEGICLNLQFGP